MNPLEIRCVDHIFYRCRKGKPGTQAVTEEWSVDWATYLCSNKNIIIAIIDGRGTLGQGDKTRTSIYYKMGITDVQDQLTVLL